jgi:hypothetical protein
LGSSNAEISGMDLSVYYNSKLLGTVALPPISITGGHDLTLSLDNTIELTDVSAFNEFGQDLVTQQSVTWHLVGVATVKAYGMTFKGIKYDKYTSFPAFNNFPNVQLTVFDLTASNMTSINVDAIVQITNPSIVSIDPVGNLTFEMFYEDVPIGILYADDASILQGVSTMSTFGYLLSNTDLNATADLMSRYLGGQNSPISARYESGTIPLYDTVLSSTVLDTLLSGANVNLVEQLTFLSMAMKPLAPNEGMTPLNATTSIQVYNPLGNNSFMNVLQATFQASMYFEGEEVGNFTVGPIPAVTVGSEITTSLSTLMQVSGDGTSFSNFLQQVVVSTQVNVSLQGVMDILVVLPIGTLLLKQVSLSASSSFQGLDGMQQVSILSSGSNVLGGNTTCLFLESMIQIYNPTIATVEVDSVSLNLYTSNTFVGVATINNFVLVPGQNIISGSVTWINTSPTVSQNFFSNWLQGISNTVTLLGSQASTPVMTSAVQSLSLTIPFPGYPTALVTRAPIFFTLIPPAISIKPYIYNPFTATIIVNSMSFNFYNNGTNLGSMSASSLTLLGLQTFSKCFSFNYNLWNTIVSFLQNPTNSLEASGQITFTIGQYVMTVNYAQPVPISVSGGVTCS